MRVEGVAESSTHSTYPCLLAALAFALLLLYVPAPGASLSGLPSRAALRHDAVPQPVSSLPGLDLPAIATALERGDLLAPLSEGEGSASRDPFRLPLLTPNNGIRVVECGQLRPLPDRDGRSARAASR